MNMNHHTLKNLCAYYIYGPKSKMGNNENYSAIDCFYQPRSGMVKWYLREWRRRTGVS